MADGANFMDDQSFLNHIARNYLCLLTYLIRQAPREKLLRIDKDRLLSAFTMRSGGTRIAADSWELGPGWTGEDTEVGREYPQDFDTMSEEELRRLWNTDRMSETIYGNEAMEKQRKDWAEARKRAVAALPVCHATGEANEGGELVGHHYRRVLRDSATRRARRNPERDPTKEDGQKKKTGIKKKTEGNGKSKKKEKKDNKSKKGYAAGGDGGRDKDRRQVDGDDDDGYGADLSGEEDGFGNRPKTRSQTRREEHAQSKQALSIGTARLNIGSTTSDVQPGGQGSAPGNGDSALPGSLPGGRGDAPANIQPTVSPGFHPGGPEGTPGEAVVPTRAYRFPLEEHLTLESLGEQVSSMKVAADASSESSAPMKVLSLSLPDLVAYYGSLSTVETRLTAEAIIRRQDILLLRLIVWGQLGSMKRRTTEILDTHSSVQGRVELSSNYDAQTWFTKLAIDIRNWSDVQMGEKRFDPNDYLPSTFPIVNSNVGFLKGGRYSAGTETTQFAVARAEEWVLQWTGLKEKKDDGLSALFVCLMQKWLGHGILSVFEVWKAAQSIQRRVLGRIGKEPVLPMEIVAAVRQMSLNVKKEEIKDVLAQLESSCWEIRSEDERSRFKVLCTLAEQSELVFEWQDKGLTGTNKSTLSGPIGTPGRAVEDGAEGEMENGSGGDVDEKVDDLIDQVFLCLKLVGDDMSHAAVVPRCNWESLEDAKIHKFLVEVGNDADKCLPFRECGRSRFYVLHSARNPYSPQNVRTVAGLFSAIMVRAIHHSTQFLLDHTPFFSSFDEWEKLYKAAQVVHRDEKYFCDPAAYGRHCGSSRHPKNAKDYWASVQKGEVNGWLLDKDQSGDGTTNLLLKVVKILSGTHFYGIGKLTAFQIAVDYMRAGVLEATVEDFVATIRYVNMGGIAGLVRLGYLEKGTRKGMRDYDELEGAFKRAVKDFQSKWNEKTGGKGTNIDMVDVEHWLCKSADKRLSRPSYYEIYE
ncbi:hypothetical protein EV361DRAFT_980594 [Lentinula raphanica]|nr:hypothetical protein EV361DRAFT_980594 [Lentinula raphanica]